MDPDSHTPKKESIIVESDSYTEEQLNSLLDSHWFKLFKKMANRMLSRPMAILTLLKSAQQKILSYEDLSHFSKEAFNAISTTIRLIRASVTGKYTSLSRVNLILCLAAIIYFINPIDVIPDFLALGLLDDVAIITWVSSTLQFEYDRFLAWEDDQKIKIDL